MLITGIHTCEHCNSTYEWEYQVPQRYRPGIILDVEKLDKTKAHPCRIEKINDDTYLFLMYCKKCDRLNKFEYNSELKL